MVDANSFSFTDFSKLLHFCYFYFFYKKWRALCVWLLHKFIKKLFWAAHKEKNNKKRILYSEAFTVEPHNFTSAFHRQWNAKQTTHIGNLYPHHTGKKKKNILCSFVSPFVVRLFGFTQVLGVTLSTRVPKRLRPWAQKRDWLQSPTLEPEMSLLSPCLQMHPLICSSHPVLLMFVLCYRLMEKFGSTHMLRKYFIVKVSGLCRADFNSLLFAAWMEDTV